MAVRCCLACQQQIMAQGRAHLAKCCGLLAAAPGASPGILGIHTCTVGTILRSAM